MLRKAAFLREVAKSCRIFRLILVRKGIIYHVTLKNPGGIEGSFYVVTYVVGLNEQILDFWPSVEREITVYSSKSDFCSISPIFSNMFDFFDYSHFNGFFTILQ